ncbi:MAG: DUF3320 domain-containing protein [Anditalea sp.]
MQESILPKLEASRKELLDLGMRNTLLNYKVSKARGLHIVQEKSSSIYEILVKQGKAMTFLGKPGKEDDEEILDLPELTEPELQGAYNDTHLQTNETEQKLQSKILNTYYFAKTSIEEQGVNILYLSLGMLNWFDKSNSKEIRLAPLILIPVTLERSSANERFRLRFSGAEIGTNLSLQAKMMADFNITVPDLSENEEMDIEAYMDDIQNRIQLQVNWTVDVDAIELGFFSFGKFMIYHDLDSLKWPENKKPYDHEILQSLFGAGFKESQPTVGEDHHLDEEANSNALFHVVDADSSQVLAMLAVQEGRNMVIQGPPGTGKSQTITNIIANAIGNGKKVLFVAEKMAALEVVKRRLDGINLGEACLELHSHKSNKRQLHEELKKVLDLGKPTLAHFEDEIGFLQPIIDELNAYCNEINQQINQSGHSAQEVIGYLLKIFQENKDYKLPKLPIEDIASWNHPKMKEAGQFADQIQVRLTKIGPPENLLFYDTQLNIFLPSDEETIKELLLSAINDTQNLIEAAAEITVFLGVPKTCDVPGINLLVNLSDVASKNPGLSGIEIRNPAWLNNKADIKELLEVGSRLSVLHKEYDSVFIPEAWEQNFLEIRQNLIAHGHKWYKFLIGDYKKSIKQLASVLNAPMPEDLPTKIKYVDAIMEGRRLAVTLNALEPLACQLLGSCWQKIRTDWEAINHIATYLQYIHQAIQELKMPTEILAFLERNEPPEFSKMNVAILNSALQKHKDSLIKMVEKLALAKVNIDKQPFHEQVETHKKWRENLPEIHQAVSWNVLKETIKTSGYYFLILAVEGWPEAHLFLKTALHKTWYDYLIEQAMLNSAALRKFERSSHEEIIEKFRKLDVLNQHYNRAKVALKHWETVPKQEGGGQLNILRNEFNRKARHMPIRKLMQEAGLAIQAIKPVIMMSPMSIANFLPSDSIDFDMIIFDEASQVRPVEALGAILRGRQLIVVGDIKQMPPTSFFDKMNTETDDDENVTADMQSILGMCDGQGAPQRMLRWHYRSRHESLISLSNQEFYQNKLVIFPSPGSKYRMGLAFHHLPDTVYDKGKSRTNPKEAEKVADAVIQHSLQFPKLSLGVVAFSTAQMQAIQNAIEIRRRKHPEVESFFRNHPNEPFFVKNLENVQGDERDVIFISIGYGRIEDGKVPMSFGPLNNEGGERRLNVLITRAKRRCEVFSNITSEDIKPGPNAKFGIRALKSFMYFAEHGKFDRQAEEIDIRQQPFEEVVAQSLTKAGYTIRQKVGSAGFYIDMAVVDHENPGRYLLGITCDGQSYQVAKSARDRDRLRNEVLEGMGWKIYQVWSTDWFRNPSNELGLLTEAIEKAKIDTEHEDAVEEELMEELKSLIREQPEEISVLLPVYQLATLPTDVASYELHLQPLGRLGSWIAEVVKVESPIHFKEMARRIADANGVSKIGTRIRSRINAATDFAQNNELIKRKGDFLWHPEMQVPYIRERSNLPPSSRKLQYISPEEINKAIKKVVESSIAIQPDAAAPLIAKIFGFSRVTEEMRKFLLESIEASVSEGIVGKDGEFLKGK